MAQSFGQRFLAPVTRRPSRRPHNPPRPFPTLRQTSRVQQPPRRRKSRHPNVPPVLPQQVKRAQLMRRLPAIHQLNPRRDGPIAIADQMLPDAAPPAARPSQSLRPRNRKPPTLFPQRHREITFSSVRPLRVRVHSPSSSSVPSGGNSGAAKGVFSQPLADRTLDAAYPISGAGVAQSWRGQADGDVTVFLENRWWRISWPSSVMPPAIRRHCPQRNTGYLEADFAITGSNGAGVAMVAMHGQAALVAEGLVVVQGLLEGGLELGGDLAFQLGFQLRSSSPIAAHLR